MLESPWFAIAVGVLLGFLSGLGTGGGSLLILWLSLVLGWDAHQARLTNLMFFIPSALIACLFRRRQGSLPFKNVLPGILAGCAGAFVFSLLSREMDTDWLKRLFGVLLIFTGARELCYRPRKAK